MALTDKLTAIADAIRGKTGKSEGLTLEQMATEIAGIQAGGAPLEDALAGLWPSGEIVLDRIPVNVPLFTNNQTVTKIRATECAFKATMANCTALEEAEIDSCSGIGSYFFQDCKALKKVKWNQGGTVSGQFRNCSALETVDCGPNFYYIGVYFATNASSLKTLILRNPNRTIDYANANAFNGTPFASGGTGGTVYVPAAWIETYKTATNWSALYAAGTCSFAAIEGSEYE